MALQANQLVTLIKGETRITGKVSGFVYKDNEPQLERIYISGIAQGFWISEGWELSISKEEN